MERKNHADRLASAHALAAIASLLLMPILKHLPSFPALLVAGGWMVLVLCAVARAIVRWRAAGITLIVAITLAIGWLIWFTYQH